MASQIPMLNLTEDKLSFGQWYSCKTSSTAKLSYQWTIANYSMLSSDLSSPCFPGVKTNGSWYLKLSRNDINEETNDGYYSLYVYTVRTTSLPLYMKYTFSILNAKGEKTNTLTCDKFINCSCNEPYGFTVFITQRDLMASKDDLLSNDQLKIFCELHIGLTGKDVCKKSVDVKFITPKSTLCNDLCDIFKEKQYYDVEFIVGPTGEKFVAHKVLLTARSSVFRAMFENDMKENQENQVTVANFSPEVFNEMLRYIYTDEVKNLDELAKDLLPIANYYNLDRLKVMCEKSLYKNLNINNTAEILILADMFNAHTLKFHVINFANKYAKEFTKTDGFQSMKETHLKLVAEVLEKFNNDVITSPVVAEVDHLLLNAKLSDVTLVIGEEEIPAHKVILGGQSSVFMDTFETSDTPDRIVIKDITSNIMKEVLAYLYTGNFAKNNETDVLLKVLAVAETYGIQKLKSLCAKRLEKKLAIDTAVSILIGADDYDVGDLLKKTLEFIEENKKNIMSLDNFKQLCNKKPELLFRMLHFET